VADIRAFVNVFDTGTCQVQGKDAEQVEPILANLSSSRRRTPTGGKVSSRDQLENMLRRWGVEAVILDQLPSEGQTIIEKL